MTRQLANCLNISSESDFTPGVSLTAAGQPWDSGHSGQFCLTDKLCPSACSLYDVILCTVYIHLVSHLETLFPLSTFKQSRQKLQPIFTGKRQIMSSSQLVQTGGGESQAASVRRQHAGLKCQHGGGRQRTDRSQDGHRGPTAWSESLCYGEKNFVYQVRSR